MDNFKLGKLPTKKDSRNLQFKKLLIKKNLPPLPMPFDVDSTLIPLHDNHQYANDIYGCCVISGRAHKTLRLEAFEQDIVIPITDYEVISEYFYESDGKDEGLIMLDSLKLWRKQGWIAGGKPYNIYGFAQVDPTNVSNVKYAIYLLRGLYTGFALPKSAQNQKVWDVVNTPDGAWGSWGGHCVYIKAYNEVGPVCVTWGREQQMTWAFMKKYCDEAYAIVDNRDSWVDPDTNPLNCEALDVYLHDIASIPPEPDNPNPPNPPTPPEPPPVPFFKQIYLFFKAIWDFFANLFK